MGKKLNRSDDLPDLVYKNIRSGKLIKGPARCSVLRIVVDEACCVDIIRPGTSTSREACSSPYIPERLFSIAEPTRCRASKYTELSVTPGRQGADLCNNQFA
jgi:hypothetical protein